jgi:arsenate reductase (glutaredoxin)
MKPKVYGIRNCDTMKKAFAWLDARNVAYDFHDAQKAGLTEARALALVGFDPGQFDAAF